MDDGVNSDHMLPLDQGNIVCSLHVMSSLHVKLVWLGYKLAYDMTVANCTGYHNAEYMRKRLCHLMQETTTFCTNYQT